MYVNYNIAYTLNTRTYTRAHTEVELFITSIALFQLTRLRFVRGGKKNVTTSKKETSIKEFYRTKEELNLFMCQLEMRCLPCFTEEAIWITANDMQIEGQYCWSATLLLSHSVERSLRLPVDTLTCYSKLTSLTTALKTTNNHIVMLTTVLTQLHSAYTRHSGFIYFTSSF